MTHRQLKAGYFTLAGLNTFASSYYFNYLFFFLRDHFGFGNRGNLWVTALSGLIYFVAAWQCGRFAAKFGRVLSLKLGFFSLAVVVAAAGHPFAGLSSVPFSALAGEPFVHYHPENGLATWVDQLAARHGVVLEPVLRTRSGRTGAQLAAAGMGVTIVPVSALPSRPAGTVRRLRPAVEVDVVAVVAAPSDTLVRQFVADVRRRGLPHWTGPT